MTVTELAEKLKAKIYCLPDENRLVECGYAGDFLSFVISRAPTGCAWFTVMNNINVCAVATLADVSVVILCEDVAPDEALLEKAKLQSVNLMSTAYDIYSAVNACCDEIRTK